MTTPAAAFAAEIEEEAAATRRLLERLPADRLGWRPHPKSQTLGMLAQHLASLPWLVGSLASKREVDASTIQFAPKQPESVAQVLRTFEEALADAKATLARWTAADVGAGWRLVSGDRTLLAMPRGGVVRMLACNHLYHHRGQLTVYLRLLDVPLPSVYGPTADEAGPVEAALAS